MEPDGSLPHSQVPTTCPYPEPALFNSFIPIPHPEDPSYYYPSIYAWVFQVVSFLQVSPPKPCLHRSSPPYVLHARPFHSSWSDHPNSIGDNYRPLIYYNKIPSINTTISWDSNIIQYIWLHVSAYLILRHLQANRLQNSSTINLNHKHSGLSSSLSPFVTRSS